MDFGKLLSVAQQNSANKQSSSFYSTKFTPPKKPTKQPKNLSEGIKKFLAKKEEEERQKLIEEKRKKENLLALRDHKAQSRINKHLKVCKAANKSVIADAIDNDNTAITIAGPSQPDEDDYGYVSQEASAFYDQLMNKYSNLPGEKPLFSSSGKKVAKDIASTKDRVKQALKQHEIDESLPHRRKRKSCDTTGDRESHDNDEREGNIEKNDDKSKSVKKKPSGPPPMDFMSLLKLAEKKQYEPIVIEAKPKPKPEDVERPMTKKQKKEYEKDRDWKERRERERRGELPKPANTLVSDTSKTSKPVMNKIPKNTSTSAVSEKGPSKMPSVPPVKKISERSTERASVKSSEKNEMLEMKRKLDAERRELENMRRQIEEEKKRLAQTKQPRPIESTSKSSSKTVKNNGKLEKPSVTNTKAKQVTEVKPRQFPPPDVRPAKQFPPPDMKQRPNKSMNGAKRPINRRRIEDDDEEEYDSELDDFIDDDPVDQGEDYSKYISEIFGYDKNRYRHYEDDDINMESNFAQQLKEEFVSSKIGLMEDLEDIRQEALEKKQKAMMKKSKHKK